MYLACRLAYPSISTSDYDHLSGQVRDVLLGKFRFRTEVGGQGGIVDEVSVDLESGGVLAHDLDGSGSSSGTSEC